MYFRTPEMLKNNLYAVTHCTYFNDVPSLASIFSYGYRTKVSQTRWLKTTETQFHRSGWTSFTGSGQGVGMPCFLWRLSGRTCPLCLPASVAASVPWLVAALLRSLPPWSYRFLSSCMPSLLLHPSYRYMWLHLGPILIILHFPPFQDP